MSTIFSSRFGVAVLALAFYWLNPLCIYAQTANIFRDSSDGIAFGYPSDWVEQQQRTGRFRVVVGDKEGVMGSCSLGINRDPTLAKYSDHDATNAISAMDIERGFKSTGGEITITAFEKTKIGNRPAIFYEGDTSYQSLNIKVPLRIMAGGVKVGDRMYTLSCTALPKTMTANRAIFIRVVGSLTIR
jgi:hypothetical protein